MSNWHPLTWISYMLDWQFYGPNPAGHHLTSLLIHAINSVLLFVLLNQMTGARWRSGFVAALFAWHPLHVESVAWAAERKDVLSALFWILTMMALHEVCPTKNGWRMRADRFPQLRAGVGADRPGVNVQADGGDSCRLFFLIMDFWPLESRGLREIHFGARVGGSSRFHLRE